MQVLLSVRLDDEEPTVGRLHAHRDHAGSLVGESEVWGADAHLRKPLLQFDGLDILVVDFLHDVEAVRLEIEVLFCRFNNIFKALFLELTVEAGRPGFGTAQLQRGKGLVKHGVWVGLAVEDLHVVHIFDRQVSNELHLLGFGVHASKFHAVV